MTEIEVTDDKLIIHILGMHKILALTSRFEVPLSCVVSAEVDPAVVKNWGKVNLLRRQPGAESLLSSQ